jgi:hypothetical protein
VGHSYGGLAAFYAMRELELDAATAGQVKVACLNTPFLVFAPRGFRILQALAHVFNVVLNFGAPALPFLAVNAVVAAVGLFVGIKNSGGGAGVVPLLIYLVFAGIGVVFGGNLINWIFQGTRSLSKDYAATLSARCESGELLNVRTATDEVPWYLRLWSVLSNLWGLVPSLGLTASAVIAAGVTAITIILLLVLMMMGESAQLATAFGREGFPSRGEVSNFYGQLGDLLVVPVLLFVATPLFFTVFVVGLQATLLFMLVTRSLPASFGDFAVTAVLLRVRILKEPMGGVASRTVLVNREGLGLSHSAVHESESTIQTVVQWIQEMSPPQKHSRAGS